jgi:hypothetical protein
MEPAGRVLVLFLAGPGGGSLRRMGGLSWPRTGRPGFHQSIQLDEEQTITLPAQAT